MRRFSYLIISLCVAWSAAINGGAQEPNDFFETASVISPGVLTTGVQSLGDGGLGVTYADTTLGFFESPDFLQLLDADDNGGEIFGDGFGSQLTSLPVNDDGSVPLALSGGGDLDFDGFVDATGEPHNQQGLVDLIVIIEPIDEFGVPFDSAAEIEIPLQPGQVELFPEFQNPDWAGHTFIAVADNTVQGGNDIDFWRFEGLTPGASLTAEIGPTEPDLDHIVFEFDSVGELLATNIDPIGDDLFGQFGSTVPEDGTLYFAVTGWDDFDLFGAHAVTSEYTLSLHYDGDTDGDNDVDGGDLLNLVLGFGTAMDATRADGDNDGDGDVDRDDVTIWRSNAGAGAAPLAAAGAAIPEPSSVVLACVLLLAGALAWRARHRWSFV